MGISWTPDLGVIVDRRDAIEYLERDGGRVPCSRYGSNSRECAPAAWAAAVIVAGETGTRVTRDLLDECMSLVVNDSDGPAELIADYGREYGVSA